MADDENSNQFRLISATFEIVFLFFGTLTALQAGLKRQADCGLGCVDLLERA